MNMPQPSIKNDEFQIFCLAPSQKPPPPSSFLSELLSFSLRLFSGSCDSLKAVNNSYLPGEISHYWLLVWWLSRPQANILLECKRFTFNLTGMWSSYLGQRWRFQPVCQGWTAPSSQHTVHYLLSLFQCYLTKQKQFCRNHERNYFVNSHLYLVMTTEPLPIPDENRVMWLKALKKCY